MGDCFGEEEDDEDGGETAQCGLEPEDVAPGAVGDDYAADEGAEGGANERAAEEPAEGGGAGGGGVDVAWGGMLMFV